MKVKFEKGIAPSVHYIDIDVKKGKGFIDDILLTYDFRKID